MARWLLVPLALAWLAAAARAADESVIHYDIVAKGLTVGHAEVARTRVRRDDGPGLVRHDVTTKVDVSLLVVDVHLDAQESALIGPDGLVWFTMTTEKDGERLETSGGLTNGVLHCVRLENGVTSRFQVARTSYTGTTLDGLELRLPTTTSVITNRVFDCARGETFDRVYRRLPDEERTIGGRKTACRVVEYMDDRKRGRRWVCEDDLGMAVVWQEAKEPAGAYSLRARKVVTRQNGKDSAGAMTSGLDANR